jgi:hypothetical protein
MYVKRMKNIQLHHILNVQNFDGRQIGLTIVNLHYDL